MAEREPLVRPTESGPYCVAGDFYIDPWRAVERAVITHAHSDHARRGAKWYLCEASGREILQERVGTQGTIETLPYGATTTIGGVQVSLHPAGHILGSSQVRLEHQGEVWVVSGDYNPTHASGSCVPYEPVRCHTFITESTFGLPIYRWPSPEQVFGQIHAWWRRNQENGIASVLPAYPLGKSQRLLAGLEASIGPIALHGSVKTYAPMYERAGVQLAPSVTLSEATVPEIKGRGLVITSSAAQEVGLIRKLGGVSWAFASGWMMTRAARRNRDFDRGFVLSDHADWPGLLRAIEATGAERIGVTHGQVHEFSRYLREQGHDAFVFPTRYVGEAQGEGLQEDAPAAANEAI
ncbi:MAG: putative mRNA 3-end processing factor [Puniceicoccaceae bacterium 5H]|nr:MAG: putative mRNA 3-end processing factor [Puniceicoccaceae bacterium 5H]